MKTPSFAPEAQAQILQLAASGRPLAVACSGGLDSVVLAHWLRALLPGKSLRLYHVHHGLQAQADLWQQQVMQLAHDLNYQGLTANVRVEAKGQGEEAAARDARYQQFLVWQQPQEVLLLAHHQDDQLETLFLRLLRGASLTGLSGMPAWRHHGQGHLFRPFLAQPKTALLHYAQTHGLTWVEDASNADDRFDRNFIRQQLLPLLSQRWPNYRQVLTRTQAHFADMAELTEGRWQDLLSHRLTADHGLKVVAFDTLLATDQAGVLVQWLARFGLSPPSRAWLDSVVQELIFAGQQAHPKLRLAPDLCLRRHGSALYLVPELPLPALNNRPLSPGQEVSLPGLGHVRLVAKHGDGKSPVIKASSLPCELRLRQPGDQLRVANRQGVRTLKNLLQEYREPRWWRERLPLLCRGEEILALADLCVAEGHLAEPGELGYSVVWQRPIYPPL